MAGIESTNKYNGWRVPLPNRSWQRLRGALEPLRNLLCPPECVWCGARVGSGEYFCSECRQLLVSQEYRCRRCATPLPQVVPNHDCFRCRDSGWKFARVVTLGAYRGKRREAVILAKKRSFEALRHGLGHLLAAQLVAEVELPEDPPPVIVPVPYHWTHALSRSAPTAFSLAQAIAESSGLTLNTRIVRRIRKTAKQGMLSWSERRQNVRGAFAIRPAKWLSGRHVLVVDDVLTSGATAAELARQLKRGGAQEITIVVIARGTGTREASSPSRISPADPAPLR